MSKILPPRAQRPQGACAAYGCPLLGTMATSSGGEWWCFAHHGKNAGDLQRITHNLHRVKWLLMAISDVRLRANHPNYGAAFERICHDLALAQRNDLAWTEPETEDEWLHRLERELMVMLAEPAPPVQEALSLNETNSRVSA